MARDTAAPAAITRGASLNPAGIGHTRAQEVIEYRNSLLHCISPVMARLGSAWLLESIPLTGVKQTAMLRRGNANY
jgi:hypothetical protein